MTETTPQTRQRQRLTLSLNGPSLSPSEQAHIDSAGEAPLEAASSTASSEPAAEADAPAAPASTAASTPTPVPARDVGTDPAGPDAAASAEAAPDTKPRMVPHAALHEEREARKTAEKRAAMLEERTGMILEAIRNGTLGNGAATQAAAAPEADALPEFKADPAAHVLSRLDRTDQVITGLAQLLAGQQQAAQQKTAAESAWGRAHRLEEQFKQSTPDHDAAMVHLKSTRHNILNAMGMTDAAARERQISQEMQHIALVAAHENRNPAELLYAMAGALGYKKAAPAAAAANGAAAASSAASPGARLAAAAAGQRQAGALGTVPGAGPVPLTAARLIEMSDADFARAIATPEGRALLGA